MLISCLPALPADTVLDVAITVVRLIAAATREGKAEDEVEEGDEEHAAAEAEQRAEAAGDGAGGEDDQRERGRDDRHASERRAGLHDGSRLRTFASARGSASAFSMRARLGLLARGPVGAREPRAGVDVGDRAVIDVAELVGFDRHRPARELLLRGASSLLAFIGQLL